MSTNNKHPHVNLATTHLKRALQKGKAAAEKVTCKILGSSEHKEPFSVRSSVDSNYSELQFAADSSAVEVCNDSNENLLSKVKSEIVLSGTHHDKVLEGGSSKSGFALLPLLLICGGLFHAFYKNDCRLAALADESVPLYSVVLVAAVSFLMGRLSEVFFGSRKSSVIQQSQRYSNAVSLTSHGNISGQHGAAEVLDQNDTRQLRNQEELTYTQQIIHKLYSGKQKVKRKVSKAKRVWTVLSSPELPHIHISRDLNRHLLTYHDFTKSIAPTSTALNQNHDASTISRSVEGSVSVKDTAIGHCVLNNSADTSFEDGGFEYIIEPMCSLRGMDLFLADDPEVEIWRQPLLIESGLRKFPTLVVNLMLPFGNMTVYMKLPRWFGDWSNIPEEKDEDSPDVKAMKRFLNGDDEYRNARTKLMPYFVDGPMAIRLIKPKPQEFNIHGARHPVSWHKVDQSIDPKTGKKSAAIMECDIDLVSNPAIRKIVNMVRPHLSRITIDLALIVSKPKGSEIDEQSACIGMWRIDKVDFEGCAVLPHKSIEEVAKEVQSFIALEA